MTVYVDDMKANFRNMVMCHMISDNEAELHAMADRIGVQRKWYQANHYDIALSKRALAIRAGAVQITWRQSGAMIFFQRRGLPMPTPENAERELISFFEETET